MKILFLTNHLRGDNGYSRYSLDFIKEIQRLDHEVLALTSQKTEQNQIREYPILEKPLKYSTNPLKSYLTTLKAKKIIKEFSPEIIHFLVEPYAALLPFLNKNKIKTILTIHGTYSVMPILFKNFWERKSSQYLSKKYYKKLDGIVAISNYTKDHLLNYYPGLKPKVKVITNGIDLKEHRIIDLSKKPKNKVKKLLFVGAIKERKGILEAIEACRYYRDNFLNNFIFDIIGSYNKDNDYYRYLLRKVKDYHLESNILFQGKATRKELNDFYFNADLFLMPSINIDNNFEGFGLVFLEANSKGVPCIGSRNSGCREAIKDGKTGYIVDSFYPKEIAQKMNLILNKRIIKPENCLEWAKQNDIKIKTKELINFYRNFVQRKCLKNIKKL